jgi:hypothetical protein
MFHFFGCLPGKKSHEGSKQGEQRLAPHLEEQVRMFPGKPGQLKMADLVTGVKDMLCCEKKHPLQHNWQQQQYHHQDPLVFLHQEKNTVMGAK